LVCRSPPEVQLQFRLTMNEQLVRLTEQSCQGPATTRSGWFSGGAATYRHTRWALLLCVLIGRSDRVQCSVCRRSDRATGRPNREAALCSSRQLSATV
jgi:hypothetical protein